MKTERFNYSFIGMALLAWLAFAPLAQAYYNPGAGRWLNRDPLPEDGFTQLHLNRSEEVEQFGINPFLGTKSSIEVQLFVKNDVANSIDGLGLHVCQSCPPIFSLSLSYCECPFDAPPDGYELPPRVQGCTSVNLGETRSLTQTGSCLRKTWGEICRYNCSASTCTLQKNFVCSVGINHPGAYVWKYKDSSITKKCP